SGIRIHEVVERAADSNNVEEETRAKNIDLLSRHLQKALRFQRRIQRKKVIVHKTCKCLNLQYSSGFITSVYLFTKLLYAVNVVAQLLLMNQLVHELSRLVDQHIEFYTSFVAGVDGKYNRKTRYPLHSSFLRTNKYEWYGVDIIRDLISGVKWESSGFFPRVSVCDFEIRQMANIQKYSVQCVLVINMYAILFASSIFSIISWFFVMVFPCFSRWFVAQHLELSALHGFNPTNKRTSADVARFVHSYLHRDGIFVLRMLSSHAGVIFTTDLVCALYRAFYGIEECAESTDESQFDNRRNGKKAGFDFEGGGPIHDLPHAGHSTRRGIQIGDLLNVIQEGLTVPGRPRLAPVSQVGARGERGETSSSSQGEGVTERAQWLHEPREISYDTPREEVRSPRHHHHHHDQNTLSPKQAETPRSPQHHKSIDRLSSPTDPTRQDDLVRMLMDQ
ncbi:hypothetical protein PRIPAC_75403, partial [Pristionchus pacificus]|uniref:Innexin n=1 Tax=Pristionchus pacificus TaxID=54126 RepID=A0A2A6C8T3_PRIPA